MKKFSQFKSILQSALRWIVLGSSLSLTAQLSAQELDIAAAQRDLSIFSGILEESLRLNESTGLFGMSLGGVEATYLFGQGAVFEIRSPLANRRNRMGLASLSSAMQALQLRQNPFEAVRLSAASSAPQTAALVAAAPEEENRYSQLLNRISSIDFSLVAQSSVQQAAQSARSLRALGDVDDASYAELEAEIEGLRELINENIEALRGLESDIRAARLAENAADSQAESIASSTAADPDSALSVQLNSLLEAIEPVKERALEKAAELKERSERAEREYALAWQRDLELFREQIYQSLCEYGGSLRTLAGDEYVSLVLKGLGEDQGDGRRTDEVHVVSYDEIASCANGTVSASGLQQSSTVYSY